MIENGGISITRFHQENIFKSSESSICSKFAITALVWTFFSDFYTRVVLISSIFHLRSNFGLLKFKCTGIVCQWCTIKSVIRVFIMPCSIVCYERHKPGYYLQTKQVSEEAETEMEDFFDYRISPWQESNE